MKIDHITYYGGPKNLAQKFYGDILKLMAKEIDGKIWVCIGKKFILHLSSDKTSTTNGIFHFGFRIKDPSSLAIHIKKII